MAIPKYNPYAGSASAFNSAPTDNWLGVLSKILGGYYQGKAGRFDEAQAVQEAQQRGQMLSNILSGGKQQPYQQQADSVMAGILGGKSGDVGMPEQVIPTQLPMTQQPTMPEYARPEFLQNPENLPIALNMYNTDRQSEFSAQNAQRRQAEMLQKAALEREGLASKERIAGMKGKGGADLTPYEKGYQTVMGRQTATKELALSDDMKNMEILNDKFKVIEENLPKAFTGFGSGVRQLAARVSGTNQEAINAKSAIDSTLGQMVATMLKPTFGGQISDSERAFLMKVLGNTSYSQGELQKIIDIGRRAQQTRIDTGTQQLQQLKSPYQAQQPAKAESKVKSFEDLGI